MESKRMILAIALSVAIWFVWMHFFAPKTPEKKQEAVQTEQKVETPVKNIQSEIKVISQKVLKETSTEITTDKYSVSLSNKGGVIDSFKYKERNVEFVVKDNMFKAKGVLDFGVYLDKDELVQGNALENAVWDSNKVSDNAVKYSTTLSLDGKPVRIEKTYTFNNGYYFQIEYNFVNPGNKAVSFPNNYVIISPSDFLGPDMDFTNKYNTLNPIYSINGDFKKVQKGGGFLSKAESFKIENGDIKWTGIMSRYFLLIMLSENNNGSAVICDNRTGSPYRAGMQIPLKKLEPGEKISKSFKVYAGEKDKDKLAAVDASLKDAADINKWIEPIRDFLVWCLMKINKVIGNFGWSLVIFSILTKLVLLPLTAKSTESMRKMQELTPKMNELKAKYKDKPDQMNKEVMKLYKSNKVNPMGGCLPLILQMPFFFALWSALINSIDLWQAPFIFWIHDLSLPDTVMKVFGYNLNILPLIMTATSFIQQKMMPSSGAGQQQKMMMYFMPLIFIVIFWNMPSGLVLYWTLQNAMQILHQVYSNRKALRAKAA